MIRKYLSIFLVAIFISFALTNNAHALFKAAKVTLVVVDEFGSPLEGVDAGVGFENNTGWDTETKAQRGMTDANGRFTATGNCNGHIGYGGMKEGYYRSHYEYDFKDLGAFGWEPWNPELIVVMRKIEKPVPMYARKFGLSKQIEIPELDKAIGFDLIASDWVAPYGKGQYSDFVFILKRNSLDPDAFLSELTIEFLNKHDGIIKIDQNVGSSSQFKLSRFAPDSGYQQILSLTVIKKQGEWYKQSFANTDNYIFRVRSSAKGDKSKNGMYGKISGPIRFYPARSKKTALIEFTYYLNPDYTRNLEFDPKRNLFSNLPDLEHVTEP